MVLLGFKEGAMGKAEQHRVRALLTEAITVLCKNGLQYKSKFSIEGLLGITLDDEEIFLVNISQTIKDDGDGDSSDASDSELTSKNKKGSSTGAQNANENKSGGRARPRKQESPQMLVNTIPRKPVKRLAPDQMWSSTTKKSARQAAINPIVIKEEVDPDENIGMTAAEMNMLLWQQQSQQQAAAMAVAAAAALSNPSQLGYPGFTQTPTISGGRSQKHSAWYPTGRTASQTPVKNTKEHPPSTNRSHAEIASDSVGDSADFFQIARTILKLEGSFISARVIRRRYQRFSTEMIVNTMKAMTKPHDDKLYVGEYHSLRKKIQVFYKSPPDKISQEALDTYSVPLDLYTNQYYRSARPAKGGPFDWAAYYSIVKSAAPFPLPEDSEATASESLMSPPRNNAFLDYATPHLLNVLSNQKDRLQSLENTSSMWHQAEESLERAYKQNLQSRTPNGKNTRHDPIDLGGDSLNSEVEADKEKIYIKHEISDDDDDSNDADRLQINEDVDDVVSSSTLEQLKALTHSIPAQDQSASASDSKSSSSADQLNDGIPCTSDDMPT